MNESNVKPIKTYDYQLFCDNCKANGLVKIPFGVIAMTHNCVCVKCGISQLEMKEWLQKEYGQGLMGSVATQLVKG